MNECYCTRANLIAEPDNVATDALLFAVIRAARCCGVHNDASVRAAQLPALGTVDHRIVAVNDASDSRLRIQKYNNT